MQTVYERIPNIEDNPNRKRANFPDIIEEDFWQMFDIAKRFSMVHITGFYNVYCSIRFVAAQRIPGDFVECGVWMGGVSAFTALARDHFGLSNRTVWLYDTFAGFPAGASDVKRGVQVKGPRYANFRAAVEANVASCGIDLATTRFVEGPVETTLLKEMPEHICMLRLDTDFYESTKVEMELLYPRLCKGGVLILDDYGIYEGSRRATDEKLNHSIMLTRVDKGIRCGVKA